MKTRIVSIDFQRLIEAIDNNRLIIIDYINYINCLRMTDFHRLGTSGFFSKLKTLHGYDKKQDLALFNNKDIVVGRRPVNFHEWFKRGVVFISELSVKYEFQTNFLRYYQFIIWQGQSERSDCFFLDQYFAIWTVSIETVIDFVCFVFESRHIQNKQGSSAI